MLIQIVDDSPNMREAVKAILDGLEAEFMESSAGEEAVRQFASRRPDVVVMDIRMEGMDGIAAARAMRNLAPDARVIIVTQYDDSDLRAAARNAGAYGYVPKDDLSGLRVMIS